ncbi:MAG: leucyl aminopeptidase family protein [Crocinitomicaceae bacterium]
MIQIAHSTEANRCASRIFILENNDSEINGISNQVISAFLSGDKKFDYFKQESGFTFLVKANQKMEEIRVLGNTIEGMVFDSIDAIELHGSSNEALFALSEGLMLSSYRFTKHFSKPKTYCLQHLYVPSNLTQEQVLELTAMGKAVGWTRDMVNTPVSHLNAEQLAEAISDLGKEAGFSVQILGKAQIEALKMGGLLAVNKGSIDPPTFTIAEYKPSHCVNKKPIVLVGKGVVYDTGGLSLKPTPGSMDTMKGDMAGAATMAAAIYFAALQKLPVHIIGLMPATDNRPGGNAYTPGDVITMYDGTTIEVLNTDAEGRMILADALAYAAKYDPEIVIDAATLTGAALRAIGTEATIIMGNAKDDYFEDLEKTGFEVHERVVRFPFWDDYKAHMKSKIADMKNIGGPNAGMISAGKFLEHFVKAPYIHMDIAGPAWLDSKENYKGDGGTGAGVRLLYHFLKNRYK